MIVSGVAAISEAGDQYSSPSRGFSSLPSEKITFCRRITFEPSFRRLPTMVTWSPGLSDSLFQPALARLFGLSASISHWLGVALVVFRFEIDRGVRIDEFELRYGSFHRYGFRHIVIRRSVMRGKPCRMR